MIVINLQNEGMVVTNFMTDPFIFMAMFETYLKTLILHFLLLFQVRNLVFPNIVNV